jgi:hypothetical protein
MEYIAVPRQTAGGLDLLQFTPRRYAQAVIGSNTLRLFRRGIKEVYPEPAF